jgi:hypothetical protein
MDRQERLHFGPSTQVSFFKPQANTSNRKTRPSKTTPDLLAIEQPIVTIKKKSKDESFSKMMRITKRTDLGSDSFANGMSHA